jgi:CcmD family protein
MTALGYVGAAYAVVWLLIFLYAWRLTARSRRLAAKLEELERALPRERGA